MGFFDSRTYTQWSSQSLAATGSSALTYDERIGEQCWYTINNGTRIITRLDREGVPIGATIQFPTSISDDIEGLCFLGSSGFVYNSTTYYFCALEEGEPGAAQPCQLYFFNMDRTTTTISAGNVEIQSLSSITTYTNLGAEGVGFNRGSQLFYVGVQQCQDGGGGLWEIDPSASWSQTLMFRWYATVGPGGANLINNVASCGDVYVAPSWFPSGAGNIFVLFNSAQGAGNSDYVVEMDESGNVLSSFDYGRMGLQEQWEGICFDDSADYDMYIIGEPTGVDWRRYSVRSAPTTSVVCDWRKTGTRWDDSNIDYIGSSPPFYDATFDPDDPPGAGAAFETGQALFGDPSISGLTSPHPADNPTTAVDITGGRPTYMLNTFSIADVSAWTSANLHWIDDDGIAIWINGTFMHKDNVSGTIAHSVRANSDKLGTAEGTKASIGVSISPFVTGTNKIAAMGICSTLDPQTDAGWDFKVELVNSPTPAPLPSGGGGSHMRRLSALYGRSYGRTGVRIH